MKNFLVARNGSKIYRIAARHFAERFSNKFKYFSSFSFTLDKKIFQGMTQHF